MTLPGAEVMKAGFIGEEIFLSILGFEIFEWPLSVPLALLVFKDWSPDAILCSSDPLMSAYISEESRRLMVPL